MRKEQRMIFVLSCMLILTLVLSACGGDEGAETGVVEEPAVVEEEATVETEAVEEEASEEETESTVVAEDATVMTDTVVLTGTEVNTEVIVTTDTEVLTEALVTSVITETELITDVDTDTTEEVITDTAVMTESEELSPTSDESAEGDAEVMTDTMVITDSVDVTDTSGASSSQIESDAGEEAMMVGFLGATDSTISAEELIGYSVVNLNGEGVGEIEDIVVDLQNGNILFVNLGYGGFLDLGEEIYPIPLNSLRYDATAEALSLNVAEETLENAPGYPSGWPDLTSDEYSADVETFWNELDPAQVNILPGVENAAAGMVAKASTLLDNNVQDAAGEENADVEDLLINMESGQIEYVVLGFGGFLEIGEELRAIPYDSFQVVASADGTDPILTLDVDQAMLEGAPTFDASAYDFADPDWDVDFRNYWGID
jgi:sporulation protein YlmC with PRC-barrel domain